MCGWRWWWCWDLLFDSFLELGLWVQTYEQEVHETFKKAPRKGAWGRRPPLSLCSAFRQRYPGASDLGAGSAKCLYGRAVHAVWRLCGSGVVKRVPSAATVTLKPIARSPSGKNEENSFRTAERRCSSERAFPLGLAGSATSQDRLTVPCLLRFRNLSERHLILNLYFSQPDRVLSSSPSAMARSLQRWAAAIIDSSRLLLICFCSIVAIYLIPSYYALKSISCR